MYQGRRECFASNLWWVRFSFPPQYDLIVGYGSLPWRWVGEWWLFGLQLLNTRIGAKWWSIWQVIHKVGSIPTEVTKRNAESEYLRRLARAVRASAESRRTQVRILYGRSKTLKAVKGSVWVVTWQSDELQINRLVKLSLMGIRGLR